MHASPIYFGNPNNEDGKVNNGTVTLITHNGKKYGVTNHHVIDAFRKRFEDEDINLYIGNQLIDLDKIVIDENEKLDLCTLSLDEYEDGKIKSYGEVPTHYFDVGEFSIGELKQGDFVLFGGYPGAWRSQPEKNELIFDTLSSGGTKVSDVTDSNIVCVLAVEKCVVTLNFRDELPDNLGGISGGPVFCHEVSEGGISTFRLVGVIYEYTEAYDALLIRPISLLSNDMSIVENDI